MSKKIIALYCLVTVILLTLAFSHFIDIPNTKEGFDDSSQMSSSSKDEEDGLLTPSSAPGTSPSGTSPSSDNTLPPNYGIPKTSSPKVESFQTRNSYNPSPSKKTPTTNVFNHIFSTKQDAFQLKTV